MLNGENINPTVALSVFIKQGNKYINLPFTKGGHHGNTWKRAALNINNMKGNFQFIFEVMLNRLQRSEVAIDDIIFDNNFCQKGLNGCEDLRKDCKTKANNGDCNRPKLLRMMFGECCATCNDPVLGAIKPNIGLTGCTNIFGDKKCEGWASVKECTKSKAWMEKNCCKECKSIKSKLMQKFEEEQRAIGKEPKWLSSLLPCNDSDTF